MRFLVVGGLTTAFSYAIYALLLLLGLNYAISNFGALVGGILFGFKTQGTLVFGNPDNRLIWRFVACWLLIYAVNVTFIQRMMSLGLNAYISGALALPVIAAISYLVQRFLVFRLPAR
ncbi:MAG TPA: GtrA family protein [Vicinamibacterales bacterium]|nr:GtrA family protein [Vicinamibacterales bacterium]